MCNYVPSAVLGLKTQMSKMVPAFQDLTVYEKDQQILRKDSSVCFGSPDQSTLPQGFESKESIWKVIPRDLGGGEQQCDPGKGGSQLG